MRLLLRREDVSCDFSHVKTYWRSQRDGHNLSNSSKRFLRELYSFEVYNKYCRS